MPEGFASRFAQWYEAAKSMVGSHDPDLLPKLTTAQSGIQHLVARSLLSEDERRALTKGIEGLFDALAPVLARVPGCWLAPPLVTALALCTETRLAGEEPQGWVVWACALAALLGAVWGARCVLVGVTRPEVCRWCARIVVLTVLVVAAIAVVDTLGGGSWLATGRGEKTLCLLARACVGAAAVLAWSLTHPPKAKPADDLMFTQAGRELGRAGGSTDDAWRNFERLSESFWNEGQILWQRFYFILTTQAILTAGLAGTKGKGAELHLCVGTVGLGLSLVWVHFTRVGARQTLFHARVREIWHEAYLGRCGETTAPSLTAHRALHWEETNNLLRTKKGNLGPFESCRLPLPRLGGMSRVVELMAWIAASAWLLVAWRAAVLWFCPH